MYFIFNCRVSQLGGKLYSAQGILDAHFLFGWCPFVVGVGFLAGSADCSGVAGLSTPGLHSVR